MRAESIWGIRLGKFCRILGSGCVRLGLRMGKVNKVGEIPVNELGDGGH